MSRSRKKTTDELEQLKAENRELKSINKSLMRQIRKLEKEYKTEFVQELLIKEDIEDKKPKAEKCSKCARGTIKTTELGPRSIQSCTICDFRRVVKNG